MMNTVLGIIDNTRDNESLKELGRKRSLASVPIGGRYRMIDFVLSNMVNSGIRNVGILVQSKYSSLMDHLRSGKEWDLDRKRDGLFILPPNASKLSSEMRKGDLDNFYDNLSYIHRSRQKYVIISGVSLICNIDYKDAFKTHLQSGADITVLYKNVDWSEEALKSCTTIDILKDGRIVDMEVKSNHKKNTKISMEMYILEKNLLIDIINDCVSRGGYDFVKDGIIKNLARLKVHGFEHEGYVAKINTIQGYYKHNLDLLNPQVWEELFFKPNLIYTKVKDQAPTKYMENAEVSNALVANECVIEGKVENSILFRGVRIHKGAQVKNSIIMEKCEIGENVILENTILDKEVLITQNKRLAGVAEYPIVIEKKTVI